MKPQHWVPPAVFLGVSIPVVLLLNALDVWPDHRVWVGLVAGVVAVAFAQSRLRANSGDQS